MGGRSSRTPVRALIPHCVPFSIFILYLGLHLNPIMPLPRPTPLPFKTKQHKNRTKQKAAAFAAPPLPIIVMPPACRYSRRGSRPSYFYLTPNNSIYFLRQFTQKGNPSGGVKKSFYASSHDALILMLVLGRSRCKVKYLTNAYKTQMSVLHVCIWQLYLKIVFVL